MTIEYVLVIAYMLSCIGIGLLASRKVLASRDEYWVAGRRIGTMMNAMAIMATLASGGSIIGVMGYAYSKGIPYTLALFAGAVLGFPLASILVAKPLRNFGKFTITDFLAFRFPHPFVRVLAPITVEFLLGIEYQWAVTISTLIFILYVSIGGMLAITWTDVMQGALMLVMVIGTALVVMFREGSPMAIMEMTATKAPELGRVAHQPLASYLGSFVIWAAAIPVIPHIVMRVFTARDAHGARLSLNVAMILYSLMILAAVFTIVPMGKIHYPDLKDADTIFLKVMQNEFPPFVRGLAVAAVLAAVMSTTDALLLACSSAITHDLLGSFIRKNFSPKSENYLNVAVVWLIGLMAMYFAYSPPALITQFYSAAIGLLTAALFVPVIAGLWWKKANLAGGMASMIIGFAVYLFFQFSHGMPPLSAILIALPVSALVMWIGGRFAKPPEPALLAAIEKLHRE
jgi:Na+/proline symporter